MPSPLFVPSRESPVGLAASICVFSLAAVIIAGCKSDRKTGDVHVSTGLTQSGTSQTDLPEGSPLRQGSTSLSGNRGSGSLGNPAQVVVRDWRLLRRDDTERRVVFWCHVPSVGNENMQYMDVLQSQQCLVWYVHVGADRKYIRQAVYQVTEHSDASRLPESGESSRTIFVSDPPGLPCDEGCTSRAVIDEITGLARATDVGLRSEPLPLSEFPVLLEWQVVGVIRADEPPTWLPENDRRAILSGSEVIREDRPPPPPGRLAPPSHRLLLCREELQRLLQVMTKLGAPEAALVLRVSPAPGSSVDGYRVETLNTETRIPLTRKRIQECLDVKVP